MKPGVEGARAMKSRTALLRAGIAALSCVLLLQASCVAYQSSGSSGASADSEAVAGIDVRATNPRGAGVSVPAPCRSETLRAWSFRDVATRRLVAYGRLEDLAVSQTGTATVAWTESVDSGEVHTMNDPAAPGDPQSPAGPPDPQRREVFDVFGDGALGVDAADTQTLIWLSDERGPGAGPSPFTEFFDIVVADRNPGARWSDSPAVLGAGTIGSHQLAVNAAGAAVVAWSQYEGRRIVVHASYRAAAGAEWAPMESVATNSSAQGVGIDDSGHVLLLFSRTGRRGATYAVRRTPAGTWQKPDRIFGDDEGGDLVVAADGSAIVMRTHFADGATSGYPITYRMAPSGRWKRPVRHRAFTDVLWGGRSIDIDARGKSMMAGWEGTDLIVKWSRPDGTWRRPCVIAQGVNAPQSLNPGARVEVNRRGDALVVWGAKGRVPQLWARFKPAGRRWSQPVKLTRGSSLPDSYTTELGDGGHAAIAWMPRNGRQLHVVRTSVLEAEQVAGPEGRQQAVGGASRR